MTTYTDHQQRELDQTSGRELDKQAAECRYILKRTYARACEYAEAIGQPLSEVLGQFEPSTAKALRDYIAELQADAREG